ncbi:DctP family TRAP transporter solute-binding subunit [Halobacillus amylolyticus]|uniref:DctP family TRAP transporter solute-binding subunit n=1 Tax=Halobacillus amylolyticus TaxID=2932259 RepID=A0ABY4H6A0_9BACI|nr:DctP family TRAP transporter solute-binding subunit [Halobacillus amylolyticus]UOR10229.1 DctP family TRAP transporter solute-binding subunit [Halobacillus amylolyticus]
MKKITLSLFLVGMAVICSACSIGTLGASGEEVKTMRLAVVTSEDRSLTKGLYKFQEIVEKKTNGKINVEVYPNGVLGGDREVLEGLQLNTIQGTTISTGPIAQFAPRFQIFDLPFLFPDKESAYDILDGPIGDELLKDLPEQNLIGLSYMENGFRQLTNNVKEIDSVEDIEGLDIRTLQNELHMDIWSELGANPTPISYTELYLALEQGTVDGQENPVGNVVTANFYEVQQYLTKTNHVYNASVFMVSKPFWESLTEKQREIMSKAAIQARDYQREINQKESEEAYDFLREKGMTITELAEEQRQEMIEAVQPVYEKYKPVVGEDLLNKVLKKVQ